MQTYPARVAAEAAQTPQLTIRRWIDSGVMPLHGNDSRTTGSGNYIGLSRNRILQLAITQALLKSGVSLSRAAKAALEFTDSGNTGRAAGEVYSTGKTILTIGGPNGPAVRNVDFNVSVFDQMSNDEVTITVDLNRIAERVDSVLNKH
jgi:hypothetical protein